MHGLGGFGQLDIRSNYEPRMDTDPVALARWVAGWFHRYERAGGGSEEAGRQIGRLVKEREIPTDVLTMAMFLVDLDAAADALFTELGAQPIPEDGFDPHE